MTTALIILGAPIVVYVVWMSWLLANAGPAGEPPRHGVHIYRRTLASRGRRK